MKVAKEKIQKILYDFANMQIDQNSTEHKILCELLQAHPKAESKIGSGIDYFYVQKSKWKVNQYNFMIRRTDGSSMDFSYLACLNPQWKASKGENWSGIFRNVIKEQTDSFRASAFEVIGKKDKFVCSHTDLKFKKIYAHVDHVYPLTFDSIFQEFIETNKLNLNDIKLSCDTGTSEIEEILDKDIVDSFYKFHKKRAILRMVYNSANWQGKRTKNYGGGNPVHLKRKLLKKYPQYHIKD